MSRRFMLPVVATMLTRAPTVHADDGGPAILLVGTTVANTTCSVADYVIASHGEVPGPSYAALEAGVGAAQVLVYAKLQHDELDKGAARDTGRLGVYTAAAAWSAALVAHGLWSFVRHHDRRVQVVVSPVTDHHTMGVTLGGAW